MLLLRFLTDCIHQSNFEQVKQNAKKVFIEKPGLVDTELTTNIYVGYVLRHAPCIAYLKDKIADQDIKRIKVEIRANTVLEQGSGWRASAKGGGVVNEFGSHAINLAKYLATDEYTITDYQTEQVVSRDCPDKCAIQGSTESGTAIEIHLNWSDASVRKPTYLVEVELADGNTYATDFFQVWCDNGEQQKTDITGVASWENRCAFYIRGLEFSEQARYFSDHNDFTQDLLDSIFTDRILGQTT